MTSSHHSLFLTHHPSCNELSAGRLWEQVQAINTPRCPSCAIPYPPVGDSLMGTAIPRMCQQYHLVQENDHSQWKIQWWKFRHSGKHSAKNTLIWQDFQTPISTFYLADPEHHIAVQTRVPRVPVRLLHMDQTTCHIILSLTWVFPPRRRHASHLPYFTDKSRIIPTPPRKSPNPPALPTVCNLYIFSPTVATTK